jgi:hypothetical protein
MSGAFGSSAMGMLQQQNALAKPTHSDTVRKQFELSL